MQGDHDIHKQTDADSTVSKHTNEETVAKKEKGDGTNKDSKK